MDCSKGPDSDKESFADLVQELAAVFKPRGLLLSSAVSPSKMVIDAGYDVPRLARYLDWIAVMTYDYHGQWDQKTGHVAPLYYHPDDDNTYFNAVSDDISLVIIIALTLISCTGMITCHKVIIMLDFFPLL